jgi:hypothetical protein
MSSIVDESFRRPLTHDVSGSAWIRLPRAGSRCPVSGLSRSSLATLVRPESRNQFRPPVEARILKRRGAARGIVLINRASLLEYINDLPSVGVQGADQPTKGES